MKKSGLIPLLILLSIIMAAGGCTKKSSYEFDRMWGTKGTGDGQFQYVEDFAFDKNGYLLATDALNANVQVFSKDGKFITKFGKKAMVRTMMSWLNRKELQLIRRAEYMLRTT